MTHAFAQEAAARLEQEESRDALERVCVVERRWGTGEETRIAPLREHHNRITFDIAVRTTSGWHQLIAKVYTEDRADLFQAMRAVARAGFGPEAEFSIPQAFAYLPALRVRLEEKVDGPSVNDLIETGRPDEWITAAERCGEWLGRFHRAAPRPENGRDLVAKLAHNRDAVTHMPSLRSKAKALLARLEALVPLAAPVMRCAGHGSYIPNHVILSGPRTIVIDLDDYDAADPSRDVAWFLVSLQRRAIQRLDSPHALDDAAQAFLGAYRASGPRGALDNLPLYRALMCLSRARRDLYKHCPALAAFMLDQALQLVSV
jgi:aminoglycoside phosphotransferase (APT) family kinase protein